MNTYYEALTQAMTELGRRDNTIFLGQTVLHEGTGMHRSFAGVPEEKRIELPVFENTQLGISLGLSLAGYLPISVFPRWNFLIEAISQLTNHLDKWAAMGGGSPRVIIRTAAPYAGAGTLDPGPQHVGDYTEMIRPFIPNVKVVELLHAEGLVSIYMRAAERDGPTLLVERQELY